MARAKPWYARAAAQEDAASMFHLGWLYERAALQDLRAGLLAFAAEREGREAELADPDVAHALEWYRKAADKGFAPAMNNLGQLYLSGLAGPTQPEKAIEWIIAAAKAGNPVAAMYLSMAYMSGEFVPVDGAQSQFWSTWLPKASSAGDLIEPVFTRTELNGMPLPAAKRAEFRAAAETGRPVTTTFRPMPPNPSIPTFKSVQRELENQGSKDAP
jgi:TPR repeat protein